MIKYEKNQITRILSQGTGQGGRTPDQEVQETIQRLEPSIMFCLYTGNKTHHQTGQGFREGLRLHILRREEEVQKQVPHALHL